MRISPYELHINDPRYFNQLYSATSRLDKYAWYYRWVKSPLSVVATQSHEHHSLRRRAMSQFFSESSVARLEPQLRDEIKKLLARIQQHKEDNKPVDLSSAFRSVAIDMITDYCFPISYNFIDKPDFARSFYQTIRNLSQIALWHRHFPFVFDVLQLIPRSILGFVDPESLGVADFQKVRSDPRCMRTYIDLKWSLFG